MAVGWGGLIAAVGLIAATGRGEIAQLSAAVIAFVVGGFLAGVRASDLRPLHAALAAVAAYLFYALFVALAGVGDLLGGPPAPEIAPGSNGTWAITAAVSVIAAVAGGVVASVWLRPHGRDQRRRPA